MRLAAFVIALSACGGIASDPNGGSAGGTDVTNGTDGHGGFGSSGTSPAPGSPYRVVFASPTGSLLVYRTATEGVTVLTSAETFDFVCTYDGAAIAADQSSSIVVLDGQGAWLRTQSGTARAIRPDAFRMIADRPINQYPLYEEGALDATGAYLPLDETAQSLFAQTYAPDGTTVLWFHRAYDHDSEIVAAPIDLSSRRVIAKVVTGTDLLRPAVSFDGSRVAYLDCGVTCDLDVVDLPTGTVTTLLASATIASPQFVPDGTAIVFYDRSADAIEVLDIATSSIRSLVTPVENGKLATDRLCVTSD